MFDIAKPASEARAVSAVSAVADGVGRAVCALTRAEGARARERERREAERAEAGDSGAETQHRRWYCVASWERR